MKNRLEFSNITKAFPGIVALSEVSFCADSGHITALLGENGAGKSTLLKILSGDIKADSGEVLLDGEAQNFKVPSDALRGGISVIYQERQMVASLSVMENIFAGELPHNKFGVINYKKLRKEAQELIDLFELPLDARMTVGRLSVAQQQMVEIMRAYRRNSDVIAFDEPTASLADTEITILFRLIKELARQGKIVIYVSHRMAEIFQITDKIIVLKDGKKVADFQTGETDEPTLVKAMVGREIGDTFNKLSRCTERGDTVLEVKNLTTKKVTDISLTLRSGEIVGLAGLVGAGRTELARAIFGADKVESGEIVIEGRSTRYKNPSGALACGVALCPEDRKEEGLVLSRSIRQNITVSVLSRIRKFIFLDNAKEKKLSDIAVEKYDIKTPSTGKLVGELSGGNQQKVILGRATNELMATKVLILDEPTKGIDVGSKAEIYQIICDFAKSGMGVIVISSELPEVLNISDTIYVMANGKITGVLSREEASEEHVLELAMAGQ
ncbi:MAG: sugar ABC transporter ATP-binding protein [Clostridiales Family XIII bacterium]|nr:sugar ABC transporter ATP-binding protein [Clostridiales Family XIII bacterium]